MVRKLNILLIASVLLFVFSGCPEFYTFNLFDGLDYVKLPSAEDLNSKSTDEGLDYLDESIASDSFIAKISEDPEALAVVVTYLENIYTDPGATEDQRVEAAVLAADLQLGVNGSDDLIDNVFNAITGIQNMGDGETSGDDQATVQAILTGIMPPSVTELGTPEEQEAAFVDIIVGLLAANEIYSQLGDELILYPADGNPDVTGGTLINAAVAAMVAIVVEDMIDPDYTPTQAAGVLWAAYQAALTDNPDLSGITGFNESPVLSTDITQLDYIKNIATTAGIDVATLFGTPA